MPFDKLRDRAKTASESAHRTLPYLRYPPTSIHIKINPTNIKLDDALIVWVQKKIGSLEKFLERVASASVEARVEIGKPSRHHHKGPVWYAEVNLRLPGKLLRATDTNKDLRTAVNHVKDELQRQIKKYLGKKG